MSHLPFEDASLEGLDPSLMLHGSSEIDTALLSDIDGKHRGAGGGLPAGAVWRA